MIDNNTFDKLSRINEDLIQLCGWLNERGDLDTVGATAARS